MVHRAVMRRPSEFAVSRRRSQFPGSLLVAIPLLGGHPVFECLSTQKGLIVGEDQPLPTVIVAPDIGRLHGGAGCSCVLEQLHTEFKNLMLMIGIKTTTARIAEREIKEDEPGDSTVLDDVLGRSEHDGRNAVRFELTCNQTHGLVTDRSNRRHHRHIDLVFDASAHDFGRIDLGGLAFRIAGVDAVKPWCKLTDPASVHKFA
jgi:hypothetical protein